MPELRITGGTLKSRKVTFDESKTLRPTLSKTREAIFNVLANYINFQNATFLDLFAGSGIMSFEAASRGLNVYAIELNKKTCRNIQENIYRLSVDITLIQGNAVKKISELPFRGNNFDIIFLDPPYKSDLYLPIINKITENNILSKEGFLITESEENDFLNQVNFLKINEKRYSGKIITFFKYRNVK